MKARWYLVQVDMESTPKINQIFRYSGKYYCMFLANNPNKKTKSGKFSIWWQDWYH